MAALALYTDCQARWGETLTAGQITQVNALLIDASAAVLDVAALDTDWTAATLPAAVLPVICAVVRRAYTNLDGLQGETIGDYTWRGVKTGETSTLYLTPDEKRTIRRAASKLGVVSLNLSSDLPLAPVDPRYYQYTNDEGIVIVNAAEPEDL
jgi:hypothetical protein